MVLVEKNRKCPTAPAGSCRQPSPLLGSWHMDGATRGCKRCRLGSQWEQDKEPLPVMVGMPVFREFIFSASHNPSTIGSLCEDWHGTRDSHIKLAWDFVWFAVILVRISWSLKTTQAAAQCYNSTYITAPYYYENGAEQSLASLLPAGSSPGGFVLPLASKVCQQHWPMWAISTCSILLCSQASRWCGLEWTISQKTSCWLTRWLASDHIVSQCICRTGTPSLTFTIKHNSCKAQGKCNTKARSYLLRRYCLSFCSGDLPYRPSQKWYILLLVPVLPAQTVVH